jgi:hypothetical protein
VRGECAGGLDAVRQAIPAQSKSPRDEGALLDGIGQRGESRLGQLTPAIDDSIQIDESIRYVPELR